MKILLFGITLLFSFSLLAVKSYSDIETVINCTHKIGSGYEAACAGVKTTNDIEAVKNCTHKIGSGYEAACAN